MLYGYMALSVLQAGGRCSLQLELYESADRAMHLGGCCRMQHRLIWDPLYINPRGSRLHILKESGPKIHNRHVDPLGMIVPKPFTCQTCRTCMLAVERV